MEESNLIKMEHVELFEDFDPVQNPNQLLLGYYGDGGHGSHPALLTSGELSRCGFVQGKTSPMFIYPDGTAQRVWGLDSDPFTNFHVVRQLSSPPPAICCYLTDGGWEMMPIDREEAEQLVGEADSDTIHSDSPLFPQAMTLAELDPADSVTAISFIVSPIVNAVYWSTNPEASHGVWQDGKPTPLQNLV